MKRFFALILIALMLIPAAACGGRTSNTPVKPTYHAGPKVEYGSSPGKLYFTDLDTDLTITALQLSGNRAGSAEFNAREPALVDIRSIFELNEWITAVLSFNRQLDGTCTMYVCRHRDFSDYDAAKLAEVCETSMEAEVTDHCEAEFYLDPESCTEGYYDLLFTRNGKIIAYTVIKLYAVDSLAGLSDAELERMMSTGK